MKLLKVAWMAVVLPVAMVAVVFMAIGALAEDFVNMLDRWTGQLFGRLR